MVILPGRQWTTTTLTPGQEFGLMYIPANNSIKVTVFDRETLQTDAATIPYEKFIEMANDMIEAKENATQTQENH